MIQKKCASSLSMIVLLLIGNATDAIVYPDQTTKGVMTGKFDAFYKKPAQRQKHSQQNKSTERTKMDIEYSTQTQDKKLKCGMHQPEHHFGAMQ
ncbi:hypothetical protein [Undibacterium aquatile]|uniref:Secreted protein n=1 Tax=Undibacterium aquatile TaxID=1537398 RepID=A0ABR6XJC4_9BURK|nr:hypothetical protein [Undibacterium aquatile]MBC3812863.1 hypothetical protein [Undibacterium aquatile]